MTPDPETLNQRPQAPDNLVEVRGVHFTLGERVIYKAVDLDIARGRITAIMGPSGTGKTTLLRLISGQWRPGKGTVHFDGAHVAKLSQNDLFEQRKRMGMLFQSGALLTDRPDALIAAATLASSTSPTPCPRWSCPRSPSASCRCSASPLCSW